MTTETLTPEEIAEDEAFARHEAAYRQSQVDAALLDAVLAGANPNGITTQYDLDIARERRDNAIAGTQQRIRDGEITEYRAWNGTEYRTCQIKCPCGYWTREYYTQLDAIVAFNRHACA